MGLVVRRRRESGQRSWLQFSLRWGYGRWVQVLAHGDLLGRDGRPSQSKLAAFVVMMTGCFCAVWSTVRAPTGASSVGASIVTIIIAGLSASMGIRTFTHFLDRTQVQLESKQLDETKHVVAEITERRAQGGALYEPTLE